MLPIQVSMDKMTIEFKDIHMEIFIDYELGDLKKNSSIGREFDIHRLLNDVILFPK